MATRYSKITVFQKKVSERITQHTAQHHHSTIEQQQTAASTASNLQGGGGDPDNLRDEIHEIITWYGQITRQEGLEKCMWSE